MQISLHFSDKEFELIGCEQRLIDNAIYICTSLLEPIRNHFSTPISIHSGYRDLANNTRVGGKPNSFHLYNGGQSAVDISIQGHTLKEVFDWIRLQSKLPFDQVILETYPAGQAACIHLQIDRSAQPRRLAYVGGVGDSHTYTLVQSV